MYVMPDGIRAVVFLPLSSFGPAATGISAQSETGIIERISSAVFYKYTIALNIFFVVAVDVKIGEQPVPFSSRYFEVNLGQCINIENILQTVGMSDDIDRGIVRFWWIDSWHNQIFPAGKKCQ